MERSNIILIGMPASGKSTVGVILAKLLGYDFIDTDLVIQRREGMRLPEIIESRGLEGFLEAERRACAELEAERTVIATGGSAVYGEAAMAHLSELGIIVYLEAEFEPLRERLLDIRGRGVALRPGQTLRQLYDERVPLYRRWAGLTVSETGLSLEETVEAARRALDAAGVR